MEDPRQLLRRVVRVAFGTLAGFILVANVLFVVRWVGTPEVAEPPDVDPPVARSSPRPTPACVHPGSALDHSCTQTPSAPGVRPGFRAAVSAR